MANRTVAGGGMRDAREWRMTGVNHLAHRLGESVAATLFGMTGWAIGSGAMMAAYSLGSRTHAIAVHAILLPVAYVLASLVYFRRPAALPPLATAVVFGTTVVVLDVLVRAALGAFWGARDFAIVTAIPAFGAAAATWLMGVDVR